MAGQIKENVFFFIPNVIGYARIILAFVSFYFMPFDCVAASVCYVTSALLDAVDGFAARTFNQNSRFGAMLDQLTDRCGTTGLLMVLCYFYPKYMFFFQVSATIDIACHWIYLHAQLLRGRASHKYQDLSDNPIMSFYYKKVPLTIMCAFNEAFYCSLYFWHFQDGPFIPGIGMGLFKLTALIMGPFAILKSFISILHGIVAARNLVSVDEKEREEMLLQISRSTSTNLKCTKED